MCSQADACKGVQDDALRKWCVRQLLGAASTYVCAYIYIYRERERGINIYIYIYTYIHIHIPTHVYIYIYIYIYTCVYIYIYMLVMLNMPIQYYVHRISVIPKYNYYYDCYYHD